MSLNRFPDLAAISRMSAMRQAITITITFLLILVVAGAIAISAFERETQRRIEDELQIRFAEVRTDIERLGFDPARYPDAKNERIEYFPGRGDIAEGIHNSLELDWRFWQRGQSASPQEGELDGYEDWIYLAGPVRGGQLIVATDLRRQDDFLQIMLETMGLVGLGAAFSALCLGLYLGARTQRRINAISGALGSFGAGDLSARVGGSTRHDDLGDLSRQLDATLDQLDALIRQSRDFASNIAHDLKTPLARLRIRLDQALMASEDGGNSTTSIEAAVAQAEQITAIFDAFLRIAKLETGTTRASFAPVDLGQVAEDMFETYRYVVEDTGRNLMLDKTDPVVVSGDRVLLMQAIANLLENAIRHTPKGTRIWILAHGRQIGVADDGPGIPPEEFGHVTQPLYRLERSRTTEGVGLGLSLVKTIANLHDAELLFSENPQLPLKAGLYVQIEMPCPVG
ncbi:HAMP domain-containing sensor histidine kinase [Celeribacter halophilus]|uniref:histidine kinase n=1 Tax=Celeribacter halophilus TaxID=576117 RepID=A0AAW7XU97_9RHOB|nr:HAMP domain-containing sensor histidine kinase [Celeribacter halophilus]MDO6456549.1 HAMP domain-containing sensor histidine kinase [Celeribacter halophilus]MDO6723012.1 HAMP domain-containing sensor histidine kinase [Celeribacter halophilus]